MCTGRCGTYININVTAPESVIIPCGNLLLSNASSSSVRVDYCNGTGEINEPLVEGATMPFNLTTTKPDHLNNTIYCTNNQTIFCYKLTVFCKCMIRYGLIVEYITLCVLLGMVLLQHVGFQHL